MADNPTTTSVVRIYRFPALPKAMLARISAGRSEAARVWMHCRLKNALCQVQRVERLFGGRSRDIHSLTGSVSEVHSVLSRLPA